MFLAERRRGSRERVGCEYPHDKQIQLKRNLRKVQMKNTSWDDLPKFASRLHREKLSISEQAEAIVWFRFHCKDVDRKGLDTVELAKLMDLHHLCNRDEALRKVNDLVRGSQFVVLDGGQGGLVMKYRNRDSLDSKYGPLLDLPPEIAVSNDLIFPVEIDNGGSFAPLFRELVRQANICYEYDLPDACAVLCRRLVEVLLIKSFVAHNQLIAITDKNGDVRGLGTIIGKAKSGDYISLHKDTKKLLEYVYNSGNNAAHSEFYMLKKKDTDRFEPLMDKALTDLLDQAKIKRK